jgi:hypothetical protein
MRSTACRWDEPAASSPPGGSDVRGAASPRGREGPRRSGSIMRAQAGEKRGKAAREASGSMLSPRCRPEGHAATGAGGELRDNTGGESAPSPPEKGRAATTRRQEIDRSAKSAVGHDRREETRPESPKQGTAYCPKTRSWRIVMEIGRWWAAADWRLRHGANTDGTSANRRHSYSRRLRRQRPAKVRDRVWSQDSIGQNCAEKGWELCGVRISLGALSMIEARVSDANEAAVCGPVDHGPPSSTSTLRGSGDIRSSRNRRRLGRARRPPWRRPHGPSPIVRMLRKERAVGPEP